MKYVIDYEYGIATLYSPSENWEERFYSLAEQCFGIRKSIGEVKLLKSCTENSNREKIENEYERLEHHGDVIIWDNLGNKIKSEWDF